MGSFWRFLPRRSYFLSWIVVVVWYESWCSGNWHIGNEWVRIMLKRESTSFWCIYGELMRGSASVLHEQSVLWMSRSIYHNWRGTALKMNGQTGWRTQSEGLQNTTHLCSRYCLWITVNLNSFAVVEQVEAPPPDYDSSEGSSSSSSFTDVVFRGKRIDKW